MSASLEKEQSERLASFASSVLWLAGFMFLAGIVGGVIVLRAGVAQGIGEGTKAALHLSVPGVLAALLLVAAAWAVTKAIWPARIAGALFLGEGIREWTRLRASGVRLDGNDLFATVYLLLDGLLLLSVATALFLPAPRLWKALAVAAILLLAFRFTLSAGLLS